MTLFMNATNLTGSLVYKQRVYRVFSLTTKMEEKDNQIEIKNTETEKHDDKPLTAHADDLNKKVIIEKGKIEDPNKENQLVEETNTKEEISDEITFKIIFNRNKYDICFSLSKTVIDLKAHLQTIIGVPQAMQKVMFKGLARDERTLRELGITKGAKIMVVGSKLDDVLAVSTAAIQESSFEAATTTAREPLCKQKIHRKVLDKGVPEDAMPGISHFKQPLPHLPLSGMLNKAGGKVRLTFKLELDQLWIGSKERTEKIPMTSIKSIVSEPIEGHDEYHIIGLQLGPTEASRYWIYWVPAQYVDSLKEAILGPI